MTATSGVAPEHRPDESMSLLVDIATQALDPSYAAAAARREAEGRAPAPHRPHGLLAMAGVLGATLVLVLAGVQAHEGAPLAERSRQSLLDQVHSRTVATAALQRQLDALRDRTRALRDAALTSSSAGSAVAARLATEELVAGTVAVRGPGLRVTVDDATAGSSNNQVLDRDLQSLVNALWAGGAEAVAVDDQRLTAQSAIRQAGSSILVNFEPVERPYVLTAIGDPVRLATSFAASPAAAQMRTYQQLYGLRFGYNRADDLAVPRAPGLTLNYARAARPAGHAEERR